MRRIPPFRCVGVLLTVYLAAPMLHAETIERILAVVSGHPILLTDVTEARDLGLVPAGDQPDAVGAILDRLIDRALMLTEVERFVPPEPEQAAVDERLAAIRARFGSSDDYDRALARSGADEAELRETIREDLRIQAYLGLRFTAPRPTDEEVASYYTEHLEAFAIDGRTPDLVDIRPRVVEAMNEARRRTLVDDWVAGLRRRADIVNLYRAGGAGGTGR